MSQHLQILNWAYGTEQRRVVLDMGFLVPGGSKDVCITHVALGERESGLSPPGVTAGLSLMKPVAHCCSWCLFIPEKHKATNYHMNKMSAETTAS